MLDCTKGEGLHVCLMHRVRQRQIELSLQDVKICVHARITLVESAGELATRDICMVSRDYVLLRSQLGYRRKQDEQLVIERYL